jgi:hypothetical protein
LYRLIDEQSDRQPVSRGAGLIKGSRGGRTVVRGVQYAELFAQAGVSRVFAR